MKHFLKRNGGFTLVELLMTIVTATLVTVAATTVLLLALRINNQTADTASHQYTVRTFMSALEKTATNGSIKKIVSDFSSWSLLGKAEQEEDDSDLVTIFSYDSEAQTISVGGAVALQNVYASSATLSPSGLLTVSIETADGTYTASVYCRMLPDMTVETLPGEEEDDSQQGGEVVLTTREAFLQLLKSQVGSKGQIIGGDGRYTYYSEWYIDGYKNGWNWKTPWCACYVSWALDQLRVPAPEGHPRWFAEVDDFMQYFQNNGWHDSHYYWQTSDELYMPQAGDLVFFDWIVDRKADPQHVGVVIYVDDSSIYTIEGNSAGQVMIRNYNLLDPRILGYGVIWPEG